MEKLQIFVYLIGGFTDNIKIYNCKFTELGKLFNITFVQKEDYKSPTRSSNKDLLRNYSFDDIIEESQLPKDVKEADFQPTKIEEVKPGYIYCYCDRLKRKSGLFITLTILNDFMFHKLQQPSKPLSKYCQEVIELLKQDEYVLVGNRCSYLQKALHGKDKLQRLLLIGDTLQKAPKIKNIVLATDDEMFVDGFRWIFGDILKDKNLLVLKFNNNDEHEYIQVATYCTPLTKFMKVPRHYKFRKFIHDHSGFYTLLEGYIGINKK